MLKSKKWLIETQRHLEFIRLIYFQRRSNLLSWIRLPKSTQYFISEKKNSYWYFKYKARRVQKICTFYTAYKSFNLKDENAPKNKF